MTSPPPRLGAVRTAAAAVRHGRCSAVDLVEAAIGRLAHDGAPLNLLAAERFDAAHADAARADRRRAVDGPAGPVDGVPALIKDLEDVRGLPTRKGSLLLEDAPPATRDSRVTGRLRAAGAIVVGKTTLPEFAIEGHTANLATGVTRNPWQLEWSPGGSSGGSAASVAAGLVAIATATDGGGSVRIPAACCGLVGLKPTNGVVARAPIPDWIDFSTDGVFATTTDDLALLLELEAGPASGDPTAYPVTLTDDPSARPTTLLVADRTSDLGELPEDVRTAFGSAVDALAHLVQLPVTRLEPASIFGSGDPDLDWFLVATAEHVSAIGRAAVEQGMSRFHPATQEFLAMGLDVGIDDYLAARRRRFRYVLVMDDLLGPSGILVTPTLAVGGVLAEGRLPGTDAVGLLPPEVYSTALQNVTGHPAISVPAGFLPNGLPFGLQLTAPRFADHVLIALARRWEAAFPWPTHPPGFASFVDTVLRVCGCDEHDIENDLKEER